MINSIVGSYCAGSFIKTADKNSMKIVGALDGMNNPKNQLKIRGMDDLLPFIGTVEGLNGEKKGFETNKIYGIEDGQYADAPAFKPTYESWNYTRSGVRLKDYEFTLSTITDAYERNIPIGDIVTERVKAVADWYMNSYIPSNWYQTLFRVPTAQQSQSLRAAPVGFLKNTPVDRSFLKPQAKSNIRNNYKAVSDVTDGLTIDDLEKIILEFTEFKGMSDGNLAIYGSRGSLAKSRGTIAADVNKDEFNRTGKPSDEILGVQFIQNDMIPSGKLLLFDGNMRQGLTHFVSPKPDLRGMSIVKDLGNGFDKIDSIRDYIGAYWRVMPEGRFIEDRWKFCWIDLNNAAIDDDLNMSEAGLEELREHEKLLHSDWTFLVY
jgi:hypothetical protein